MTGNPLRWRCDDRGCFNEKKRPKIEVFAECFDSGINFGDVDMIVEKNGRFLMGEWKPAGGCIGRGQRILHDMLLQTDVFAIVIICGDAETMQVDLYEFRHRGASETTVGGLDSLKARIRSWFEWAKKQPRIARRQ